MRPTFRRRGMAETPCPGLARSRTSPSPVPTHKGRGRARRPPRRREAAVRVLRAALEGERGAAAAGGAVGAALGRCGLRGGCRGCSPEVLVTRRHFLQQVGDVVRGTRHVGGPGGGRVSHGFNSSTSPSAARGRRGAERRPLPGCGGASSAVPRAPFPEAGVERAGRRAD